MWLSHSLAESVSAERDPAEPVAQETLGLTALTGELASWKQKDEG